MFLVHSGQDLRSNIDARLERTQVLTRSVTVAQGVISPRVALTVS